ncbi:hypothetical protein BKA57DRAFT_452890 [Linnemannia elongata]|nr:hypothetical protein BKA57DRAFT_452890 [Linnemannia elongata]
MLRNTMTNNHLTLFCLVDGEATSNAFSVKIPSSDTVDDLKDLIKTKKAPRFDDVAADELTLWHIDYPVVAANKHQPVLLNAINSPTELDPTDDIADVFAETPPKKTIHVLVQRPPPVHAPVPSRALTPLPGSLSDGSRPGTPLSGDLHTDIKKITDKFFASGSGIANFLDAFVKGQGALPVTSGPLEGLPTVGRRQFGKPPETRPSLLFMDLPDPSTPDSDSRNLAAGSILDMVKENNRYHIPKGNKETRKGGIARNGEKENKDAREGGDQIISLERMSINSRTVPRLSSISFFSTIGPTFFWAQDVLQEPKALGIGGVLVHDIDKVCTGETNDRE